LSQQSVQHRFVDVFSSNTISDLFQVQQIKHSSTIIESIFMNENPRFIINGGDFINKITKKGDCFTTSFVHHNTISCMLSTTS
jgi:hypothetical protein